MKVVGVVAITSTVIDCETCGVSCKREVTPQESEF